MIEIKAATTELIPSFYEALKSVAAEKIFLEMVEPPSLEKVMGFQQQLMQKNGPIFYAVNKTENNEQVVGWCDIFPNNNIRMSHRGSLGMGLVQEFRGRGLGSQLLAAALKQAKIYGLEKVELSVYSTNTDAISLYQKFGFEKEGLIKKYRKLDGVYYDGLCMGLFLNLST